MATAGLPPVEQLHRINAKRTRAVFASEIGDILVEEESRSGFLVDLTSFFFSK